MFVRLALFVASLEPLHERATLVGIGKSFLQPTGVLELGLVRIAYPLFLGLVLELAGFHLSSQILQFGLRLGSRRRIARTQLFLQPDALLRGDEAGPRHP